MQIKGLVTSNRSDKADKCFILTDFLVTKE